MAFEGLTNKGREYMAKCLAENKPITFVKVKIGNGSLQDDENPETFTDIKFLKKEVEIAEKTQINDAVRMLVQVDNKGVEEGYFLKEIGVYVQDGEQEILYWYINDGTEAQWVPAESKAPIKIKNYINLIATNIDTVIVNWTGTELWVDREFLGKEMAKKVDKTISVTGTGALQGGGTLEANRQIIHKDEKGYKHIPLGGTTKQFLKWVSDGIAKWGAVLWEEIEGRPSALKNPQSLKIKTNGTLKTEYLGDTAKEVNITSADTGGLMKGNIPAIIKDEKTMFDIMESQTGLNFDTSLLFLNDAGTKQVGKLYLDKNKKGLFKCIKQTTGTVNSTEFFVEYSIKGNSDRLSNLIIKNRLENIYDSKILYKSISNDQTYIIEAGIYLITVENWHGNASPMLSLMSHTGGNYFEDIDKSLRIFDIVGDISKSQIDVIGANKISVKNQKVSNYYSLQIIKISDMSDTLK